MSKPTEAQRKGLEAWIKTRPQVIQDLAARFPAFETIIKVDGVTWQVMGYREDGFLIICPTDFKSYEDAQARRAYVHPDNLTMEEKTDDH